MKPPVSEPGEAVGQERCEWCDLGWFREWRVLADQWAWWHTRDGVPLRYRRCETPPPPAAPPSSTEPGAEGTREAGGSFPQYRLGYRDGYQRGQEAGRADMRRVREALVDAAGADLSTEFEEKVRDVSPMDAAQLGYSVAIMRWQQAILPLTADPALPLTAEKEKA